MGKERFNTKFNNNNNSLADPLHGQSDMGRRRFLQITFGGVSLAALAGCDGIMKAIGRVLKPADDPISIDEQRQRIHNTNQASGGDQVAWSNKTIMRNLTEGLDAVSARKKLFEFVQGFPYKLIHHEPRDGVELYDTETGDCRHKREALLHLLGEYGEDVRRTAVLFDWADLPIPDKILGIKKSSGTKGFHSGMDVKIGGKWVRVDPTWDPPLAGLGFPVTLGWDGVSPTKNATNGSTVAHPHGSYEKLSDLYEQHGLRYPVLSETHRFNDAFNDWLSKEHMRSLRG